MGEYIYTLLWLVICKAAATPIDQQQTCCGPSGGIYQQCDCVPDCFDLSDEKNCSKGNIEEDLYANIWDIDIHSFTNVGDKKSKFFPPPPLPPFALCDTSSQFMPSTRSTNQLPNTEKTTNYQPIPTVPSTPSTFANTTVNTSPLATVPSAATALTTATPVSATTTAIAPVSSTSSTYKSQPTSHPIVPPVTVSTMSARILPLSTTYFPRSTKSYITIPVFRPTTRASVTHLRPTQPPITAKQSSAVPSISSVWNCCRRHIIFVENVRSYVQSMMICAYYNCGLRNNRISYPYTRLPTSIATTTTTTTTPMATWFSDCFISTSLVAFIFTANIITF